MKPILIGLRAVATALIFAAGCASAPAIRPANQPDEHLEKVADKVEAGLGNGGQVQTDPSIKIEREERRDSAPTKTESTPPRETTPPIPPPRP